jgi:hypothetical protein
MITLFCDVALLSSRKYLTFRNNLQLPPSTLKMEAATYSETLVNILPIIQPYITKYSYIYMHVNFKYYNMTSHFT